MGKCKNCGCKSFLWNGYSAAMKLFQSSAPTRVEINAQGNVAVVKVGGSVEWVNNGVSDKHALRNCTCGHHWNYHS